MFSQVSENYDWGTATGEVSPEAMEHIIEYIYTGTIHINSGNVCSLLMAANLMELSGRYNTRSDFFKDKVRHLKKTCRD